jgi:hypothetical protein
MVPQRGTASPDARREAVGVHEPEHLWGVTPASCEPRQFTPFAPFAPRAFYTMLRDSPPTRDSRFIHTSNRFGTLPRTDR